MSCIKPTVKLIGENSFRYCTVCRMVSPTFKFFDDEEQKLKTFCRICFYDVDVKSSDEKISQLNLTAGYKNE